MALPASAAPLILARNVFDWVHQYPQAVLSASNESVGSEVRKLANYRRDRDWWQASTDLGGAGSHWVMSDLGAGNLVAADYAFIERGHNLWGRDVAIIGSLDNVSYTRTVRASSTVPANPGLGVGAGDPTTGWAVTEEGALYTLADAATATARYWRAQITAVGGFVPRIPGVMIGLRNQLLNYSRTYDEDAGERTENTTESRYGMVAWERTVSWRKITLSLSLIGQAEYDGSIRDLRRLLFSRGVPCICFKNYGVSPFRGWMYRYSGRSWGMAADKFYRSGTITLREEGHLIAGPT